MSDETVAYPSATIHGNIHSNDKTDFSGSTFIFGNAESVNGFNGLASAPITGTINGGAAVITLPSIADVLGAVGSYSTLTGNPSISGESADRSITLKPAVQTAKYAKSLSQ